MKNNNKKPTTKQPPQMKQKQNKTTTTNKRKTHTPKTQQNKTRQQHTTQNTKTGRHSLSPVRNMGGWLCECARAIGYMTQIISRVTYCWRVVTKSELLTPVVCCFQRRFQSEVNGIKSIQVHTSRNMQVMVVFPVTVPVQSE